VARRAIVRLGQYLSLESVSDMHTALHVLQYESNVDLWGHLRRFDRATAETLATHVS
jgi:hypothetical protein